MPGGLLATRENFIRLATWSINFTFSTFRDLGPEHQEQTATARDPSPYYNLHDMGAGGGLDSHHQRPNGLGWDKPVVPQRPYTTCRNPGRYHHNTMVLKQGVQVAWQKEKEASQINEGGREEGASSLAAASRPEVVMGFHHMDSQRAKTGIGRGLAAVGRRRRALYPLASSLYPAVGGGRGKWLQGLSILQNVEQGDAGGDGDKPASATCLPT